MNLLDTSWAMLVAGIVMLRGEVGGRNLKERVGMREL
jgi:hypothetical protein